MPFDLYRAIMESVEKTKIPIEKAVSLTVTTANNTAYTFALKYARERLTLQGAESYGKTIITPTRSFVIGVDSLHPFKEAVENGVRPHLITPKSAPYLKFFWRVEHIPSSLSKYKTGSGRIERMGQVSHPGIPPLNILSDARSEGVKEFTSTVKQYIYDAIRGALL